MPEPSAHHQLTIGDHTILIRAATLPEVIDLRHKVLRAGLPRESAKFTGDDLPTTRHFAAFLASQAVCCATFHCNTWNNQPAWQLRGMATDESFRGQGIGRQLLNFAEAELFRQSPIRMLWCNARAPALRFYQSVGWTIASEIFDIPTAGPHYRMCKPLAPARTTISP